MNILLKLSAAIDALSRFIGRHVIWLILASTVISALNAVVRKAFNYSSNAFLEVQWYLFAASFLLAAGYTFLQNEHVRIDVIVGRFSRRTQVLIDLLGCVLLLMPFCAVILWYSVPFFLQGWHSHEMSSNAGGLVLWPVYLFMPLGFSLLMLQGVSEIIKRVAFLTGHGPDPLLKADPRNAEAELAEAIRAAAAATAADAAQQPRKA